MNIGPAQDAEAKVRSPLRLTVVPEAKLVMSNALPPGTVFYTIDTTVRLCGLTIGDNMTYQCVDVFQGKLETADISVKSRNLYRGDLLMVLQLAEIAAATPS
jgi:hypothetical protein